METRIVKIDENNINEAEMKLLGKIIADGGLVAFPTETVYGLGADAFNDEAVKSIYTAKGRPSDNPLIVHFARVDDIYSAVREVPQKAKELF